MFIYQDIYIILFISIIFISSLNFISLLCMIFLNSRFLTSQMFLSIYECGFLPFHDARIQVESTFSMVALSPTIFDLEICFIIPWFLIYQYISLRNLWFLIYFLILSILGSAFESKQGILQWNK